MQFSPGCAVKSWLCSLVLAVQFSPGCAVLVLAVQLSPGCAVLVLAVQFSPGCAVQCAVLTEAPVTRERQGGRACGRGVAREAWGRGGSEGPCQLRSGRGHNGKVVVEVLRLL